MGAKLSAATGPTSLFVPRRDVSMIAVEGQPFHDPPWRAPTGRETKVATQSVPMPEWR